MSTTIPQLNFTNGTLAFWCHTSAFTSPWNMFLGDVSNGSNFLGRADGGAGSGSNRIRLRSGSQPDADWSGTFPEFVGAWTFVAICRSGNQVELFLGFDGQPLVPQGVRTCASGPLIINTIGDGFSPAGQYAHGGTIEGFEHQTTGGFIELEARYNAEAPNYHGSSPPPPSGGTAIVAAGQSNATSATIPNLWSEVSSRCNAVYGLTPTIHEVAVGGTGLVSPADWSASGSAYQSAVASINAAGYSSVPLIVWHQGEADATNGVSSADYHAALADLLARFRADCPACANADLAVAVLGPWPAYAAGIEQIRDGQRAAIDYTAGIVAGPDLSQRKVRAADGVHFSATADRDFLAESWLPVVAEYLGAA